MLTLGEALTAAHAECVAAPKRRTELVRVALERGASIRSVATHLGVAPSTVHRWAGTGSERQPDGDPFSTPAPERAQ